LTVDVVRDDDLKLAIVHEILITIIIIATIIISISIVIIIINCADLARVGEGWVRGGLEGDWVGLGELICDNKILSTTQTLPKTEH
jgi:hypothetical protein